MDMEADFKRLLEGIRKQDGFQRFLMEPENNDFMAAAEHHSIVVINVSEFWSDAILVEQHRIRSLNLPGLHESDIKANLKSIKNGDELEVWVALEWLWDVIAQPILEALGITTSPKENTEWPRICWIPIGELCQLPLHAAGRYSEDSDETVLDRVISSYSVSIRALLHDLRMPELVHSSNNALLVSMAKTEDQLDLPFAK
ncbi:hypothetical protein TWF694_005176 [Orbilia ellipsospora]|uniref:CHAT domain-containing protein n=1 Tax=Orbilia ellipsospora TaxID=2528407 RepID=A0AAV9WWD7_9PEZI